MFDEVPKPPPNIGVVALVDAPVADPKGVDVDTSICDAEPNPTGVAPDVETFPNPKG